MSSVITHDQVKKIQLAMACDSPRPRHSATGQSNAPPPGAGGQADLANPIQQLRAENPRGSNTSVGPPGALAMRQTSGAQSICYRPDRSVSFSPTPI